MTNTVTKEVYESALETNADQCAVIEELQNEIEKLTEANQRLKRIIRLILNKTDRP